MLFRHIHLQGIRDGRISLAFRKWLRPTVKTGTTLRTGVGVLVIDAVEEITEKEITEEDAKRSGFPSKASLMAELGKHKGQLYRIRLHYGGEDPRIALREDADVDAATIGMIRKKLDGLDARSIYGAWTRKVLGYIDRHPEEKAGDMAIALKVDKEWLKLQVRKLKELGLTESLKPGYRLSPRGEAILAAMKQS